MKSFRTLDDAPLQGAVALVRVDFNVPIEAGAVSDDTRLRAALATIRRLRAGGAKVVLLSHFDRPKGVRVPSMSLEPLAAPLADLLGAPVSFASDCVGPAAQSAIDSAPADGVILLENLRFHPGEEANDPEFAKSLAALGDVYVDDAFSAAHRAHASTQALARLLPAFAGESMRKELDALEAALGSPERPVLGIVGGSKVSTKLALLENLIGKLDRLAIGGGMANTFLFAQGCDVGASLCERDLADAARTIIDAAAAKGCELLLPIDVVVAQEVRPGVEAHVAALDKVGAGDRILDAGPATTQRLIAAMEASKTLIWNGPLGVFEVPPFDRATVEAAQAAARLVKSAGLIAVAGGGDTVSALNRAGVAGDFTFVSTAGGAFLEWMEGRTLPGVEALRA